MKKEDIELIKLLGDLRGGSKSQPAVPVISVPQDRDSFAAFTGGLRQNWVFVMAVVACGMWLMNAITDGRTIDVQQQNEIDRNTAAISELKVLVEQGQKDGTEIIRRLDNLQKDVDILNGK